MNDDQPPLHPPPSMDENISVALLNMAQAITTQTQAAATQDQAMMAHANQEVVPMTKKKFYYDILFKGLHYDESSYFLWVQGVIKPYEFIDEIYKIIHAMGLSTREKVELSTYQLKNVAKILYVQWSENRSLRNVPVTYGSVREVISL